MVNQIVKLLENDKLLLGQINGPLEVESFKSTVTKIPSTLGTNLLINGTFSSWTGQVPDDWFVFQGQGTGGTIEKDDIITYNGNPSVKVGVTNTDVRLLGQVVSGLTVGELCTLTSIAGTGTNNCESTYILLNGIYGVDATEIFNGNTGVWDTIVGPPTDDQFWSIALTQAFVTTVAPINIPVPSNGKIAVAFTVSTTNDSPTNGNFGEVRLQYYTPSNVADMNDFNSGQDLSSLDANDSIFNFENGKFKMDGVGKLSTTYNTFDFGNKVVVASGIQANNSDFKGIKTLYINEDLGYSGSINLPSGITGWGNVLIGNAEAYTGFRFTASGVVTLFNNSAGIANTNVDNAFCIIQATDRVQFVNRLFGPTEFTTRAIVHYTEPTI